MLRQEFRLQKYPRVFYSCALLSWLVDGKFCATRDDAHAFASALFSIKMIRHWCGMRRACIAQRSTALGTARSSSRTDACCTASRRTRSEGVPF